VVFFIIFGLFLNSIYDSYQIGEELRAPGGVDFKANIHSRLLGAQRNSYISGFALFEMLMLYRFGAMIEKMIEMKKELKSLKGEKKSN